MTGNNLARTPQRAGFEIVERDVVGSTDDADRAVQALRDHGLFISASEVRYDARRGSYAVVRFYKPIGTVVLDATVIDDRNPAPRPQTSALATVAPPAEPAPALPFYRQRWFRPAAIVTAIAALITSLIYLGLWVMAKVSEVTDKINGKAVLGFFVILAIVVIVAAAKAQSHSRSGWGFHWSPCDK